MQRSSSALLGERFNHENGCEGGVFSQGPNDTQTKWSDLAGRTSDHHVNLPFLWKALDARTLPRVMALERVEQLIGGIIEDASDGGIVVGTEGLTCRLIELNGYLRHEARVSIDFV